MKFIMKHKLLFIILIIILILIIAVSILLKEFSVDNSKSEYGDRLDGIEDVKISKNESNKLIDGIEELEEVKKCTYRLQGRLIYITITFNEEVELDKAKEIGNKVLEYLDDEEKKYYDIQITLKSSSKDKDGFPKMGSKHKSSESIVW